MPNRGDTAPPAVPAGACDCHTHVFLEPRAFPYARARAYTPPEASIDDLERHLAGLGIDRVVVVQPSVYGSDNAATLAAVAALGPARARAVAVVDADVAPADLDALARRGVRGIRLNFETRGEADGARAAAHLRAMAGRIAHRGWHVQIYASLALILDLADAIAALPVPVVLDHFGGAHADRGPDQPGLAELLALVRAGNVYVKLSSAYRISRRAPAYPDVAAIARAFIAANPERMLWGSDWPHPRASIAPGATLEDPSPPLPVDDAGVFGLLADWAGHADVRRTILRDNPARLYGFGAG